MKIINNIKIVLKQSKLMVFAYKRYVRMRSKCRYWYLKCFTKIITEDDLLAQFPQIGIQPGDAVMIHSSMTKIGLLENGPKTFVDALKKYIGEDGLIAMPSFPHRGMYDYLEHYTMFDVLHTPSKNGAITEYFRTSKGVFRSAHPTHPLAVWGKDAEKIVAGHETCKTPFAKGSPYDKLIAMNAKVVLISVNFNHLTLLVAAEDIEDTYKIDPYIPNKIYHVPIRLATGEIVMVDTPCHDPISFGREKWNMRLFPYMKDCITFGHLGKAETWMIRSQDMYRIQCECGAKGIYPFYHYRFKE